MLRYRQTCRRAEASPSESARGGPPCRPLARRARRALRRPEVEDRRCTSEKAGHPQLARPAFGAGGAPLPTVASRMSRHVAYGSRDNRPSSASPGAPSRPPSLSTRARRPSTLVLLLLLLHSGGAARPPHVVRRHVALGAVLRPDDLVGAVLVDLRDGGTDPGVVVRPVALDLVPGAWRGHGHLLLLRLRRGLDAAVDDPHLREEWLARRMRRGGGGLGQQGGGRGRQVQARHEAAAFALPLALLRVRALRELLVDRDEPRVAYAAGDGEEAEGLRDLVHVLPVRGRQVMRELHLRLLVVARLQPRELPGDILPEALRRHPSATPVLPTRGGRVAG
mmetsp:Transcript_7739/g.22925  ORF Transcript_7739/g.22925 Transcript_7739/m.22925 type:complete len:336 (+) Transcript_7739:32-1039(+)